MNLKKFITSICRGRFIAPTADVSALGVGLNPQLISSSP